MTIQRLFSAASLVKRDAFHRRVDYLLVSLKDRDNPSVRAYRINGGVVSEEPIEAF